MRSFCLLENNDSIFDRVLGKVNEKNKCKSKRKNEKQNDVRNENIKKNEGDSSPTLNKFLSPRDSGKENYYNNVCQTNCSLLDEIKNDIESFNQIVNPKILKTNQENEDKRNSNISSQKNLTFVNKSILNDEFPLISDTPLPDSAEYSNKNNKIFDQQSIKKLDIIPE